MNPCDISCKYKYSRDLTRKGCGYEAAARIKTLLHHSLFSPSKQKWALSPASLYWQFSNHKLEPLWTALEPLWTAPVVYSVSVSSAREDGSHCSSIVFGVRSPRSSCAVRRRCVCGGVCACVLLLCTLLRVFLLVLLQVLQILQHLLDQRGHAARDLHLQGHHPLSSCGHGKLKIMLRVFHFLPAQTGLIQVSFTYQTIL